MASVTVRPKPSCRLFCTTTAGVPLGRIDQDSVGHRVVHRESDEADGVPGPRGERLPGTEALGEDPRSLRVVGDAVDGWSDESETRLAPAGDMFGETLEHTLHVLEVVPARDLHHERVVRRERRSAAEDRRWPPVPVALEQPDLGQEGQDPRPVQRPVLGGQRVDGGLDDPHVGTGHPRWDEGGVGEDEGPATGQVGLEEVPRFLGEGVGVSEPMWHRQATRSAVRNEVRCHAGRLWVVEEDDVVAMDPAVEGLHVGPQDGRVVLGLARAQVPGVAGRAVQPVVQALRDGEELGVTVDDDPACVDPDVLRIAAEQLEHLRHAPAVRRGADVPHPCAVERLAVRRPPPPATLRSAPGR